MANLQQHSITFYAMYVLELFQMNVIKATALAEWENSYRNAQKVPLEPFIILKAIHQANAFKVHLLRRNCQLKGFLEGLIAIN